MQGRLKEYFHTVQGKTVAVLGAGVSNKPLIELLLASGVAVTVRDKSPRQGFDAALVERWERQGVRLRLGEDYLEELTEDVIFRSPGIMPHTPQLAAAVERGSVLTSEMEAFFRLCPCPIIAVTGSDGKTTTTSIIAGLLKAAGYTVWVGGNIGTPLLDKVDEMEESHRVVLELSSFQLMTMTQSPHIAVVTNLAPNHLDKHTDMDEYVAAKGNILAYQGPEDRVILNFDNPTAAAFAPKAPGQVVWFSRQGTPQGEAVFCRDGAIWVRDGAGQRAILERSDILLPGEHNVENYMAAIAAVKEQVSGEVIRDFARSFGGVEHRIELCGVIKGARWYNDSIGTSPSRTIAGLRSFDQRLILIAGGYDKHIPFDVLGPEIVEHVKLLILTGDTAQKIRDCVEQAPGYDPSATPIVETEDLHGAVEAAYAAAGEGDVVILSPACAAFDRFKNFMERGRVFKELVARLKERE